MRTSSILAVSVLIAATGGLKVLGGNAGGPTKSLQQAAIDGDVEQLKLHIAKGGNFNAVDPYGYTPLKRAIEGHHAEAAKLIIESGKADLNTKDLEGKTPLIVALNSGEREIAEALIAKGADIKAKDKNDVTPLNAALRMGQAEVATALIEKGADVNAADKTGQTPLTLAQQRGLTDIVALLKQKGAKEPVSPDMLYGDYAAGGNQGQRQGPAAAPAPAREAVVVDVNAIREEIKPFEGLAAALKALDDKSTGEQAGWIQRRSDNRTLLAMGVDRQFAEEMAFVKPIATEEKAAKTLKAMDSLATARKKRFDEIGAQLREQRRAALATGRDNNMNMTGSGRSNTRGTRGRGTNTGATSPGYAPAGPYGAPGARTPPRRPAAAEVNQPVLDQETQTQVQAWLNAKPEDKKSLLEAVHQMNLVDLDDLRKVAVEEQAKKTAAALSGVMMLHEERVQKITKKWQEDDARMQKLQERYGPGGVPQGRGMQPGTQQQQTQPGMRGGRRGGR